MVFNFQTFSEQSLPSSPISDITNQFLAQSRSNTPIGENPRIIELKLSIESLTEELRATHRRMDQLSAEYGNLKRTLEISNREIISMRETQSFVLSDFRDCHNNNPHSVTVM